MCLQVAVTQPAERLSVTDGVEKEAQPRERRIVARVYELPTGIPELFRVDAATLKKTRRRVRHKRVVKVEDTGDVRTPPHHAV